MTKRFCDTEIWSKEWFQDLSLKEKVLLKYIFENCDIAGFLELNLKMISFIIGEKITIDDFKNINAKKIQFEFINDNIIFVKDFIFFQNNIKSLNDLNPNNNAHRGILKILEKYNYIAPSEPQASPSVAPSQGLTSPKLGAQLKVKVDSKVNSKVNGKVNGNGNGNGNGNVKPINEDFRKKINELYKKKNCKKEGINSG